MTANRNLIQENKKFSRILKAKKSLVGRELSEDNIFESKEYKKIPLEPNKPIYHYDEYHNPPLRHQVVLVTDGDTPGIHVHTTTKYGTRHAVFHKGKKTIIRQTRNIGTGITPSAANRGPGPRLGSREMERKVYHSADKVGKNYDKLYHS